MNEARLLRSKSDRMFAGVCGGIAIYLGVDSVLVRLAFVLLALASGIGLPLYIILMIIMPSEDTYGQPPSKVAQQNLERIGEDIVNSVGRARQHPNGPTIAAGLLIILGFYFLLGNLGWLGWLSGALFWSAMLIGLGFYLILRRR